MVTLGDHDPIVITRDDLTGVIREQGGCSCPPGRTDPPCPQHGLLASLPEGAKAERVTMGPGDVIVITYPGRISAADGAATRTMAAKVLGPDVPVLVLDRGAVLSVEEGLATITYPPQQAITLQQRSLPDSLRYLAGQLRAGPRLDLLAVQLDTMAAIAEAEPRTWPLAMTPGNRACLAQGLHKVAGWLREGTDTEALAALLERQADLYDATPDVRWPHSPPGAGLDEMGLGRDSGQA
jgi:hypothetical protein